MIMCAKLIDYTRRCPSWIYDRCQSPYKDRYRNDPSTAQLTLRAEADETTTPVACSIDIGRAVYAAEAHTGTGGPGTAACSGDLLLGALAACAQLTYQMVAAAMGIRVNQIGVVVEGDLDLRGTLGIGKDVPVGLQEIRVRFEINAPEATDEQRRALQEKTEQYCVVRQTLAQPPQVRTEWA